MLWSVWTNGSKILIYDELEEKEDEWNEDECAHDTYFCLKVDAAKKVGLFPHQKLAATLRQLVYEIGANALD